MRRRTLYILVLVVLVVIIVASVGAYVWWNNNSGGGRGNGGGTNVAGATSMQYSVDVTSQGTTATYKFAAKNLKTSNMMLRIEVLGGGSGDYIYILNGAEKKAWSYSNGEWTDISETFDSQWNAWSSIWQGYFDNLTQWNGTGDWSYTSGGESIRIYSIQVNPVLVDSLFVHT
jgi:hypothetical protein